MTYFLTLCRTGNGSFLSLCQWGCLALLYFRLRGQPDRKHLAEEQGGWKIRSVRVKSLIALLAKLSLFELHMHTHYREAFFRSNRMDVDRMRQPEGYDLLGHWGYAWMEVLYYTQQIPYPAVYPLCQSVPISQLWKFPIIIKSLHHLSTQQHDRPHPSFLS